MSGPLAPLFAQVREALTYWGEWAIAANGTARGRERIRKEFDGCLDALSSIERHVQDMERALTGAQFCLTVEYGRYRDSAPTDPYEQMGREEGMEIIGETLAEIDALIGRYYAGKVAALEGSQEGEGT